MMDHIMDIKVENGKLKMEISIEDLIFLLNTDPNNVDDGGEAPLCVVKQDKKREFAERVAELLQRECDMTYDSGDPRWAIPFNDIFREFTENDESFLAYSDDGEITPELMNRWRNNNGL